MLVCFFIHQSIYLWMMLAAVWRCGEDTDPVPPDTCLFLYPPIYISVDDAGSCMKTRWRYRPCPPATCLFLYQGCQFSVIFGPICSLFSPISSFSVWTFCLFLCSFSVRRHAHVDFQLFSQKSSGIHALSTNPFICWWWCQLYEDTVEMQNLFIKLLSVSLSTDPYVCEWCCQLYEDAVEMQILFIKLLSVSLSRM